MKLREQIFLYTLPVIPFWGFLFRTILDMNFSFIVGAMSFIWIGMLLAQKYAGGSSIRMPRYVLWYAIFTMYVVAVEIFVGEKLEYDDTDIITFLSRHKHVIALMFLIIVENLTFDITYIRRLLKIIALVLLSASFVTICQVFDPYFFVYKSKEIVLLMNTYYEGRLFSIYTWVNLNSVGFSFLSMFSVYFGINLLFKRDSRLAIGGVGLVSFLVQARWIMLNFLIISFQKVLIDRKVLISIAKYSFSIIILLTIGYFILPSIGIDIDKIIEERILNKSALTRLLAFELFANQFPKQPIFGTGGIKTVDLVKEIAGRSSQIHVGFLSLLYYYGVVGGAIYIVFLYELMKRLRRVALKTTYWGTYFAFVGFIVANITLVNLDLNEHGLLLALTVHKFFERTSIENKIALEQEEEEEAPPELVPTY
ncbi:MAG: hypothetical protein AAF824_17930 [Bacteroidota bacterium]